MAEVVVVRECVGELEVKADDLSLPSGVRLVEAECNGAAGLDVVGSVVDADAGVVAVPEWVDGLMVDVNVPAVDDGPVPSGARLVVAKSNSAAGLPVVDNVVDADAGIVAVPVWPDGLMVDVNVPAVDVVPVPSDARLVVAKSNGTPGLEVVDSVADADAVVVAVPKWLMVDVNVPAVDEAPEPSDARLVVAKSNGAAGLEVVDTVADPDESVDEVVVEDNSA